MRLLPTHRQGRHRESLGRGGGGVDPQSARYGGSTGGASDFLVAGGGSDEGGRRRPQSKPKAITPDKERNADPPAQLCIRRKR